jgi:hypothetical protein
MRLQSYHEKTTQVKSRLFEMYKREYENFSQLDGESVNAMFSRFLSIMNKMKANKPQLPYNDHERGLKLLYALDQKV